MLGILLAVLTGLYYLVQRGRALPDTLVTNRVLLFALWYLIVVLILVIGFVLARNLFKLWIEHRQRALGTRFKTKLVATYIGLSLAPVLALFLFANELLQGSIDRWFSESVSGVLEQGNSVAQALHDVLEEHNQRDAARLAREIEGLALDEATGRANASRRLARGREETGAAFAALYDRDEFVHAVVDPNSGLADLPELGRGLPREALERGKASRILVLPGNRERLIVGAATAGQRPGGRALVVVGTLLDPATAERSEELISAFQSYRRMEVQRGEFKASYLLLFLLVTLLILLASTWMGLFLARRLMAPVQAFAEAMRQIARGDFDQKIDVPVDEEMAVVVESFNRMTDELSRNRAALESANQELVSANRTLAEERALVRAILESLSSGVIALDGDGNVLAVNHAARQMLRLRERELEGSHFETVLGSDERGALARAAREARAATDRPDPDNGDRRAVQVSFPVGSTWRTFEVHASPLPEPEGTPSGHVLVVDDLTELIRAQKLATWTEAARRIAHEIKNPLTPIRLAAERLRARHRDGGGEVAAQLVESSVDIIVREVTHMQQLVDEFSRFARMPGPQLAATQLEPLVGELLDLYRDLKEGIVVRAEVEPNLVPIWIDAEQIRRVLINLLDNAMEATSAPGEIVVRVHRAGDEIEISVADDGSGLPARDRDKLFLPFFSRKRRGSGLGLAIVHRIVTDHDGWIRAEDNTPRGSIFRLRLPARGAPPEESS